jgi:hypothetical protein
MLKGDEQMYYLLKESSKVEYQRLGSIKLDTVLTEISLVSSKRYIRSQLSFFDSV